MAKRQRRYDFTRRIKKFFTFLFGISRDTDPLIAALDEGKYRDAYNMRLNTDGSKQALEKVFGQELLYDGTIATDLTGLSAPNPNNYAVLGTKFVDSYHVAFLASPIGAPGDNSCIAVNGRVVLFSADFPIEHPYSVQLDVNETAGGGEIFVNDGRSKTMVFNVFDLVTEWNAGSPTTKYFADFDISDHITQLKVPMDQPVFIQLEKVGGTTGLPPGGYSYALRYVDDDGNGTGWGPSTPIIPVVDNVSDVSSTYKGIMTHGKIPDPTTNTRYGVRLKFRITNSGDFAFIEVRRVAHTAGQSLTTQPQAEKLPLTTLNIRTNPYTVIDFIDTSDKVWEIVDDFSDEELAIVEKANAVKYYDNRLTLHGPTYTTKVIDDTDLFLESEGGNIAYPYIVSLGDIGFEHIRNQVYQKAYMHGEHYGWALLCHDGAGGRAFALPYKTGTTTGVDDFTDYKIPNRREPVSLETSEFSEGVVTAADVSSRAGASVSETHEVMDNLGTVTKDDTSIINCIDHALVGEDYNPFTPTGDKSITPRKRNVNGLETNPTNRVRHDTGVYYNYPAQYNPEGWGHGIYAQGMSFEGIDESKLPDHIKSFSIVRTPPAGRVLAQGIGFYSMDEQTAPAPIQKILDELWFYSPDMDQDIGINPQLFDDIINNPSSYKIQLVSPVGFFSEVYRAFDSAGTASLIDMISYAKIMYEDNKFNYGDAAASIGRGDGYVSFGRWRNTAGGSTGVESDTSEEFIFDITGAEQNVIEGHEGRSSYLKLVVNGGFGSTNPFNIVSVATGNQQFDDALMKAWHEPLYIINIINTGASVPTPNITEYIDTGFHQKLKSIVGYSNGEDVQQYPLVDERPADCMYNSEAISVGTHTGAANQAVLTDSAANWVTNELVGYLIVNITDSGSSAIITANTTNTVTGVLAGGVDDDWDAGDVYRILTKKYVYVDGQAWWSLPNFATLAYISEFDDCMVALAASAVWDDGNRNVYGVCICYETTGVGGFPNDVTIEFNQAALDAIYTGTTGYNASFYVPVLDDKIEVWYDNRAPLIVFGGDTFVGDALFVPVDTQDGAAVLDYQFNTAFPYYQYQLSDIEQLVRPDKTADPVVPTLTGFNTDAQLNFIHQLACLFTCESRVNLSLMFNDSFPKKNYVQRPLELNDEQWANGAEAMYDAHFFYKEYEDDYGDEYLNWNYGGFHFPGTSNIDYSKALIDRVSFNQPLVGFTERLYYPDRTIWSVLRKNPGETDSMRIFPVLNVFDGSDLSGPIKFAWASNTGKGDNIYKVTDRGVCILLTDKKLLNDLTGGEIGVIGSSEAFIQAEYWIRRDVGMNDGMWISAAGVGNNLFFANTESVYWLSNNEVKDIGILDYHSKVYGAMLDDVPPKGGVPADSPRGMINLKNEEYWLVHWEDPTQYVFNYRLGVWVGYFGYAIDSVCSDKYKVQSTSNGGDVYQVGVQTELNYECWVTIVVNMGAGVINQFKEIEIFSSHKPTAVYFGDTEGITQATLNAATFGSYYLKDKGSYQNKIPRKTSGGARFNGSVLFVRIEYDAETTFTISAVNVVANRLKSR